MPQIKKDYVQFNMKMGKELAKRLAEYCEETGQSKTTAVERMLKREMDEYYSKPEGERVPR